MNRPISVAFDMTFASRNQAGSGAYARALLSAMRDRDDLVVWIITGPTRSNLAGTMRWLLRGGRKALMERPPDLLHCPSFVSPWAVRVPMVITVHDAAARHFPRDHPLEWRIYTTSIMPRRLRAAASVITGSEFGRSEVINSYGVDPERVVAIPYGLDARYFKAASTETSANGSAHLLFPGLPIGRKNLDAVLRCMAAASDSTALGRATLDISGAREENFREYSRLVHSLGLQSRVRWLGQVPFQDMPALFAGAAAVVYPSLYEGFGFPPLEAMAAGTPVVASNRGSLPEVLDGAALMVEPDDIRSLGEALEAVLTKPELRGKLRSAGIQRARMFTWERCADRTVDLYRKIVETTAANS